jgi:hypothetical protein
MADRMNHMQKNKMRYGLGGKSTIHNRLFVLHEAQKEPASYKSMASV